MLCSLAARFLSRVSDQIDHDPFHQVSYASFLAQTFYNEFLVCCHGHKFQHVMLEYQEILFMTRAGVESFDICVHFVSSQTAELTNRP